MPAASSADGKGGPAPSPDQSIDDPERGRRPVDLIRWTFTDDPARRDDIEATLTDLGADVSARDGGRFVVLRDEPEADLDDVVELHWALNGSPFEVTHESSRRLEPLAYQDDPEAGREAD